MKVRIVESSGSRYGDVDILQPTLESVRMLPQSNKYVLPLMEVVVHELERYDPDGTPVYVEMPGRSRAIQ